MHKDKLVIAVKSHGKVLRERKDSVRIPFGSEYSLLIKNLDTVRVAVRISIDGQNVTDGVDLVINPRSELELERFIKNGNMSAGNKFKFIERTEKIENGPRGIQIEDGLIRVEYQFEKRAPKVEEVHRHYYDHYHRRYDYWDWPYWNGPYWSTRGIIGSASSISNTSSNNAEGSEQIYLANSQGVKRSLNPKINTAFTSSVCSTIPQNTVQHDSFPLEESDAGITVPGSVSHQQFHNVDAFPMESETHVMVLKLSGRKPDSGELVKQAVTVKSKQKCVTCGHVNKATAKFCSECGTALEVV